MGLGQVARTVGKRETGQWGIGRQFADLIRSPGDATPWLALYATLRERHDSTVNAPPWQRDGACASVFDEFKLKSAHLFAHLKRDKTGLRCHPVTRIKKGRSAVHSKQTNLCFFLSAFPVALPFFFPPSPPNHFPLSHHHHHHQLRTAGADFAFLSLSLSHTHSLTLSLSLSSGFNCFVLF